MNNQVKATMYEYWFECGCEIKMTERMDTNPSNCPFHGAPIVKKGKPTMSLSNSQKEWVGRNGLTTEFS